MTYTDLPLIIPLLASGYLLTIYLLLMLAERTSIGARYVANSLGETTGVPTRSASEPSSEIPLREKRTPLGGGEAARKASTST